jgi:hypothetical protein
MNNNSSFQCMIYKDSLKKKKIYEIWRGKSLFCCKGKIYIGPEFYYGLITSCYIHCFSWLFIIFILMVKII